MMLYRCQSLVLSIYVSIFLLINQSINQAYAIDQSNTRSIKPSNNQSINEAYAVEIPLDSNVFYQSINLGEYIINFQSQHQTEHQISDDSSDSINRSINQTINEAINLFNFGSNHIFIQSLDFIDDNETTHNVCVDQSFKHSSDQSINQSINQPVNQPISPSHDCERIDLPVHLAPGERLPVQLVINRSINQSIKQHVQFVSTLSIRSNQTVWTVTLLFRNQSINQSAFHKFVVIIQSMIMDLFRWLPILLLLVGTSIYIGVEREVIDRLIGQLIDQLTGRTSSVHRNITIPSINHNHLSLQKVNNQSINPSLKQSINLSPQPQNRVEQPILKQGIKEPPFRYQPDVDLSLNQPPIRPSKRSNIQSNNQSNIQSNNPTNSHSEIQSKNQSIDFLLKKQSPGQSLVEQLNTLQSQNPSNPQPVNQAINDQLNAGLSKLSLRHHKSLSVGTGEWMMRSINQSINQSTSPNASQVDQSNNQSNRVSDDVGDSPIIPPIPKTRRTLSVGSIKQSIKPSIFLFDRPVETSDSEMDQSINQSIDESRKNSDTSDSDHDRSMNQSISQTFNDDESSRTTSSESSRTSSPTTDNSTIQPNKQTINLLQNHFTNQSNNQSKDPNGVQSDRLEPRALHLDHLNSAISGMQLSDQPENQLDAQPSDFTDNNNKLSLQVHNQSNNQSNSQSSEQPNKNSTNQIANKPTGQTTNQPAARRFDVLKQSPRQINQTSNHSLNHSIPPRPSPHRRISPAPSPRHSNNQSTNQSTNQSFSRSASTTPRSSQSNSLSVNQSVSQSNNPPLIPLLPQRMLPSPRRQTAPISSSNHVISHPQVQSPTNNLSINQSTNQLIVDRSIGHSINSRGTSPLPSPSHSSSRTNHHYFNQSLNQPNNQSVAHPFNQQGSQSNDQLINQSAFRIAESPRNRLLAHEQQSVHLIHKQLTNQSVSPAHSLSPRPFTPPFNQSINQPVTQPLNQPVPHRRQLTPFVAPSFDQPLNRQQLTNQPTPRRFTPIAESNDEPNWSIELNYSDQLIKQAIQPTGHQMFQQSNHLSINPSINQTVGQPIGRGLSLNLDSPSMNQSINQFSPYVTASVSEGGLWSRSLPSSPANNRTVNHSINQPNHLLVDSVEADDEDLLDLAMSDTAMWNLPGSDQPDRMTDRLIVD